MTANVSVQGRFYITDIEPGKGIYIYIHDIEPTTSQERRPNYSIGVKKVYVYERFGSLTVR